MNSTSFSSGWLLPRSIFYVFFIALFSISLSFQSCNPAKGMVPFDAFSLSRTIDIKAQAIDLMKRGGKSFSSVSEDVSDFKATANSLIDFERDRGEKNLKTVQMWELMMDPNQNLLGGFLNRWENEGKLNGPFIREAAGVVSKNFDKIIKLEKKKSKS